MTAPRTPRYRPLEFGVTRAALREGAGGVVYLRADQELQPYAQRMTDRLVHWAKTEPARVFMAQRNGESWRTITYAQALDHARRIGTALLKYNLSAERPIVVLSGNDLEHAMLRRHRQALCHIGDDKRLADGLTAGDRQRPVGIGAVGKARVDEDAPRHLIHRPQHDLVHNAPPAQRQEELHTANVVCRICAGHLHCPHFGLPAPHF